MDQNILSPVDLPGVSIESPAYPATWGGKVAYGLDYIRGIARFAVVRLTNRRACLAAAQLGDSLERTIFPLLREEGRRYLDVSVPSGDGELKTTVLGSERTLPGTNELSRRLADIGIRRIEFDVRLEDGQILDACTLLYSVRRRLHEQPKRTIHDAPYRGWDPRRAADALYSPGGVHVRCQTMRLLDGGVFRVDYSYCDLFFTSLLQKALSRRPRHRDHRTIFSLAPQITLLVGLVLFLPLPLLSVAPISARVIMALGAVGGTAAVGIAIYTLASVQYARENYQRLSRDLLERIAELSRFPEVNPHLVSRIESDGTVSYLNPAGRELLKSVAGSDESPEAVFSPRYRDVVLSALETGVPQSEEYTHERSDMTIMYHFSPFPDDRAVVVGASDVSELRSLTRELEARVAARTNELHLTRDATILALAGLAESRDPETGRHLERTRWYILRLAEHMRVNPVRYGRFCEFLSHERIDLLFKSAPLHDIGKVGIPDHILLKPERLTPEEFETMKRHTIYGAEALRKAREQLGRNSFLAMGEEIALYHHERWDGSGYPHGLAERAIPIPARLMAIADLYDALTSRRVYKDAYSHREATRIIGTERGRQLDPDIVDAFFDIEDEFRRIRVEMTDAE
ncbi:MAG: HD domain-containing protein [Spirochaetales bacterium]|nr:HD domain-containing protein [Spirochaetales bacterium]